MAVRITANYGGALRCTATHGPSGDRLVTDAPVDNHGKGEAFSPTDLVAAALGTCLLTIAGMVAERDGIDLSGTTVTVDKEMAAHPLRRIARLACRVTVPAERAARIEPRDRRKLEKAADACPVRASLHPDTAVEIVFDWGA